MIAAPTNLRIVSLSYNYLEVAWDLVTDAIGYKVRIINETETKTTTALAYNTVGLEYTLISGSEVQVGVIAYSSGEESTEATLTIQVPVKDIPEWSFLRVLPGTDDAVFSVKNNTTQSFKVKSFTNAAINGPYSNVVLASYDLISAKELSLVKGIFSSTGYAKAALIADIGTSNENWIIAKVFYKAQWSDNNTDWTDASVVAGTMGSPSSTSDAATLLPAEEEHRYWRVLLTDAVINNATSVNAAEYRLNIYGLNLDLWIKTPNFTLTHIQPYTQYANAGSITAGTLIPYTGGELVIPDAASGPWGYKIALKNDGGASPISTKLFSIPYQLTAVSYNHRLANLKWVYPSTSGNSISDTRSFVITGLSAQPIITGDLEGIRNNSQSGSAITMLDYSFTVEGLSPETLYDITVAPYINGITAMASSTLSITTPAVPPIPAAPTDVVVSNYQDNALSINWNAVTDADYYKISGVYGDQIVQVATNSAVLLNVPFGVNFNIGVLSGNEAGESAATPATAVTKPGRVLSVQMESLDPSSVTLSMQTENEWVLKNEMSFFTGNFVSPAVSAPVSFDGLKRVVSRVKVALLNWSDLGQTNPTQYPPPTYASIAAQGAVPVIQGSDDNINFITPSQSFTLENAYTATFSITNTVQYKYWRISLGYAGGVNTYYRAIYSAILDAHHVTELNIYDQTSGALIISAPYDGGLTAIVERDPSLFTKVLMLELENEAGKGPRLQNIRFDTSAAPFDLRATEVGIGSVDLEWSQLGTRNDFKIEGVTGLNDVLTLDPVSTGEGQATNYDITGLKYICHDSVSKTDFFGYLPRTNEIVRFNYYAANSTKARISPPTGASYYFNNLADLKVDNSLNIFAVDSGRRRIVKMDQTGAALATTDSGGGPNPAIKSMTAWDFGPNFIAIADSISKKVHIFDYSLVLIKTVTLRAYLRPADILDGRIDASYPNEGQIAKVTKNAWFSFGEHSEGFENVNFLDLQPESVQIYSGDMLKLTFGVAYELSPSVYGSANIVPLYGLVSNSNNLIKIARSQSVFLDLFGNKVDGSGLSRLQAPFFAIGLPSGTEAPPDAEDVAYHLFRYTVTGVDSGSLYNIKVRSVDEEGTVSLPSNTITVRTLSIAPQLRLETVDDVTAYTAKLYYSDFNVSTQLYKFYLAGQTGSYLTKTRDDEQFISFDSLEPNKEYTFTMTAVSQSGIETGMSNEVSFFTRPAKPTNIRVGKIRSGTAKIKWDVDSPATYYKIYGLGPTPITTGQNNFIARNLNDATNYAITVVAHNTTGPSEISDSKSFTLNNLPIITMFIEQTAANDNSITLNWEVVDGVDYYEVYANDALDGDDIAGPPYIIHALASNTSYRTVVKGYDSFGGIFQSFELYTKTYPESYITVTPDTDVLDPIEKTKAKIKWSSVDGAVKYKVHLNANSVEEVLTKTELSNLTAGTKYTVQIEALSAADVLINTDALEFITDLDTPTGLAVVQSSITVDSATLRWVYPGGTDGIDSLNFYNGITLVKSVPYVDGIYEAVIDGLTAGTAYSISMKSINNIMESSASNTVSFTTKTV